MKLSTKYIIIILLSILIFPISFFGVNFAYYLTVNFLGNFSEEEFLIPNEVIAEWEEKINSLDNMSNENIVHELNSVNDYPDAQIFWINDEGQLLMAKDNSDKNKRFNVSDTINFMENNYKQQKKIFTTYTYLKGTEESGFAFLQIPEKYMGTKWEVLRDRYSSFWYLFLGLVWFLFVFITWLFFRRTSKRLIKIQQNMEASKNQLIPSKMVVGKIDEIGDLELSFNRMVEQLKESHEKEKKETLIRKRLIASLSHDLRTPLAIISGHAHKLEEHSLNIEMQESVDIINNKVKFLGELIDNLSSYTVLSEGKLSIARKYMNITPVVRTSLISWYPIFEDLGFHIDINLEHAVEWNVDETWLARVLNNLFQNVKRHAYEGRFLSVQTGKVNEADVLIIADHGPGIEAASINSGAGIGLSIVKMMLNQMELKMNISSDEDGTKIIITSEKLAL